MDQKPTFAEEVRVFRNALPGALVMVAVLLLLRGYDGTVLTIRSHILLMAQSFFGSDDSMIPLLLHTLPLALSAGMAAYAISSGWIAFESVWSIVALAAIVLGGTTAGGMLQQVFGTRGTAATTHVVVGPALSHSTLQQKLLNAETTVAVPKSPVSIPLAHLDLLAVPDLTSPPPATIPPLKLLPNVGGVLGIIAMAINQLLGFVVAYQPRVFLASILAGGWTGWRWQQRLRHLRHSTTLPIATTSEKAQERRAA